MEEKIQKVNIYIVYMILIQVLKRHIPIYIYKPFLILSMRNALIKYIMRDSIFLEHAKKI